MPENYNGLRKIDHAERSVLDTINGIYYDASLCQILLEKRHLPLIWGLEGIWYSIVVAELMAVVVTVLLLVIKHKKYRYW